MQFDLLRYSFGRFLRDGSFSSHVSPPGTAQVSCDLERRQVRLTFRHQPPPDNESLFGLSIDWEEILGSQTITASYVPTNIATLMSSREDSTILFIRADAPPVFALTVSRYDDVYDRKPERLAGLGPNFPMPHGSHSLMLAFKSESEVGEFMGACRDGLHLRCSQELHVRIHDHSSDSKYVDKVQDFLSKISYGLAFEVNKAFANAVLSATEILSLKAAILSLQTEHGNDAPEIFRTFALVLGGQSAGHTRRRRRLQRQVRERTIASLLAQATNDFMSERQKPRPLLSPPPQSGVYLSYHLIITPTRFILEGPFPDRSNSVLRRYGHPECFLRVSFQDENRSKLRRCDDYSIADILSRRYRPILLNGFRVVGRQFHFLGYSMSGLKEHSVWFMTPFQDETGELVDAKKIRSKMGDLSKLSKQPARLAARWSQAFSGTDPSIALLPEEVDFNCPDRRSPSGNLMTDGCSSISAELAKDIWMSLQMGKKSLSRLRNVPSAFQFRLGGAKGMVVQDPTIEGKLVRLRPSQIKFDAPTNLTFDVQATSAAPKPMFLNRPLIALMEFLGVDSQRIIELQDDDIRKSQSVRSSYTDASKFIQQHGMGESFRLPSLFSNLSSILELEIGNTDGDKSHWASELVLDCLHCVETHALRELKYRAHIAVPGSYTLFGVSDEWDCLMEGEIYATIFDEKTGVVEHITGNVAITRSPQIHPGDIQLVKAVRRPELEHLTNVVVFSCRGQRALSSCLGGGDLDGDDFNLILDPRLQPTTLHQPAEYTAAPIKTLFKQCAISDIVDFIINYIDADLLGLIAITHLRFSDLKDASCRECIDLAKFASQAVDFPKTGTPVSFRGLPMLRRGQPRPDYLSREGENLTGEQFYESPKLLGQLFRRVPVKRWMPQQWNGSSSPSRRDVVRAAFSRTGFGNLDMSTFTWSSELTEEMMYLLDAFCERLLVIGQRHTITKNKNIHISEAELVSGTIMANWSDHARRREAVTAMNLETNELVRAVRAELQAKDLKTQETGEEESDEPEETEEIGLHHEDFDDTKQGSMAETFGRAFGAWHIAENALEDDPRMFGAQSFCLIALGMMLEIVKASRRK